QSQDAGRAARPRRLSSRPAVGAADLIDRAGRRPAVRAWPVHPRGGGPDRDLPRRLLLGALAQGRLVLEHAGPRIHPDVDHRGGIFPGEGRRGVFAGLSAWAVGWAKAAETSAISQNVYSAVPTRMLRHRRAGTADQPACAT